MIEEILKELIPSTSPLYPTLFEGGRYALLAPAKRLRPRLTLLVAELLDPTTHEAALRPAAALELVHTYSLIHDDLPSMDNDDLRRGQPTLHRVYDEGQAILIGDYLLTYAFEVLATAPHLTDTQRVALITTLSRRAGADGMIGGQVMDLNAHPDTDTTHVLKTAALFEAAVDFGAIIGKADPQTRTSLQKFGKHLGLLFQIVDDILDDDHPDGLEVAREKGERLYAATHEALAGLPFPTIPLSELTDHLWHRSSSKPFARSN